jgi:signal transduction histidine kinase
MRNKISMTQSAVGWPQGESEMAERIRSFDWSTTALGPISGWPQRLCAAVELMLASHFPSTVVCGPHAIQLYNDAYIPLIGVRHPQALGTSTLETFPERAAHLHGILERVWQGATVRLDEHHMPYKRHDMIEDAWFTSCLSPVRDEAGNVIAVSAVMIETTDRVRAEAAPSAELAATQALHELSSTKLETVDVSEMLDAALDAAIALHHADFGNIQLYDPATKLLHIAAQRGFGPAFLEHFAQVDAHDTSACGLALSDRRRRVVTDVETDPIYAPHREATRAAGYRAVQSTPLFSASGEPLGMLSTHFHAPRQLTDSEARLTDLLAREVARVIERTRARAAARQSEEEQAFLLTLSDTLRAYPDGESIKEQTVKLLAEHLRLDRCYVSEVFEHEGYSTVGPEQVRPGHPSMVGTYRLSDYPETMRQLMSRPLVVDDADTDPRFTDAEKAMLALVPQRALLVTPLRKGPREVIWALAGAMATPRCWTESERTLLEEAAERTWAAVELARVRRQTERLNAFLVHFSDAVRSLADPWTVAETACLIVAEELGVERAYWAEIDWTTREYVIGASFHLSGVPVIAGRFPMNDWDRGTSLQLAGRPVVVDDTQADPRLQPSEKEGYAQLAVGADLAVPVTINGQLRCTLAVNQRRPRRWTPEEVTLVQSIAERCWAEVERARAEKALRESKAVLAEQVEMATIELRLLSHRLLEVQEEERRHLARELHDEIGQVLTGLQFQLAAAAVDGRLAEAQRTVQDLTEQVRQLSMDLRPAVLDQYGLLAAPRWYIERYGARTGIQVDLRHEGLAQRFPPSVEIGSYRVVQEALTNVARHAGVGQATVQLLADGGVLTIAVRDEGQGFQPDGTSGTGLSGLRERVQLLGGSLTVETAPGTGTTITAELPFAEDAEMAGAPA